VEGAASAAGEDDQTVAPSLTVVKHVCVAAVDSCQKRIAIRAVKAASRAQRGRSAIEDAGSALGARGVVSRTMTARRPKILTWISTRSTLPPCTNLTTTFPAETQTAWRERPPRWPQAWQTMGSKTVVAHATVLRLTASLTALDWAGGTERCPMRAFSNSQR